VTADAANGRPLLAIKNLNVHYGRAHVLQDVSFEMTDEPGRAHRRNGMGKTTLCNAIMRIPPAHASGSIAFEGSEILGRPSYKIAGLGIGYVPQGRRLFESLTVDEHLRMAAPRRGAHRWTPDAVYELFPRLAERRQNGGTQLSGGEQQMLAIGRALLGNPKLLIMDEPSEGLAPTIIETLIETFRGLAADGLAILVVEQNLAMATAMAERQLVMVAGRISPRRRPPSSSATPSCSAATSAWSATDGHRRPRRHAGHQGHRVRLPARSPARGGRRRRAGRRGRAGRAADRARRGPRGGGAGGWRRPRRARARRRPRRRGRRDGARRAAVLARLHADGRLDGAAAVGGSGNSSIAAQAMRDLPVGVPKLIVSTVASGDTRPYVGAVDVTMMYSVVDIAGINQISAQILTNAAGAIAGMATATVPEGRGERPLVGATMFGVTTPCVTHARERLEELGYEVLVFHATGTGGQSFEALATGGYLVGALDATTTELADDLVGGVLSAGPDRLEAVGRAGIPQVVSLGALDMVNFGPRDTVPAQFEGRNLYVHNPTITLMRTTAEEMAELGRRIATKLNGAQSPTVLFIPLKGVSAIDVDGQPFHDAEADAALFAALREGIDPARSRSTRSTPTSTTRLRHRDGRSPARAHPRRPRDPRRGPRPRCASRSPRGGR
jgi:uncharacterized protein (UPF0261 family)/ABC-type branched-subunit amino acid transport system ATPase component